jgi:hypothetical protein
MPLATPSALAVTIILTQLTIISHHLNKPQSFFSNSLASERTLMKKVTTRDHGRSSFEREGLEPSLVLSDELTVFQKRWKIAITAK